MKTIPDLIVMLTYNDVTVHNAQEIFKICKDSKAKYWGFKEQGLPLKEMKKLFSDMKSYGKYTALEVVEYSETGGLEGAKKAVACNCDILMGTKYFDSINNYCKDHNLKYMPFVGDIVNRPSVLTGSIDKIIDEANRLIDKGVYGIDLLAYRYSGDQHLLVNRLLEEISHPVCIAGSIDGFLKLDQVKKESPSFFTIGSAFFDNKFGDEFSNQINQVIDYMEK